MWFIKAKIFIENRIFILFDKIVAEKLKNLSFLIDWGSRVTCYAPGKMNGAGSQHGADESGQAGTSTADFNFREEKNHQLFDAENFFSRFMVRKSFRDILFLLWKQTNVKVFR